MPSSPSPACIAGFLWCLAFTLMPHLAHCTNSTFFNPILPGFHPDPSCIFVSEWNATFFCASSSFNAFPGIPIHASKDLQNWKLIGAVPPPAWHPRNVWCIGLTDLIV